MADIDPVFPYESLCACRSDQCYGVFQQGSRSASTRCMDWGAASSGRRAEDHRALVVSRLQQIE